MEQVRPRLFVSRCLGFARCRWNGEVINDEFVKKLEPLADIVHECPEMAIGLGCPRDPVRVVREGTRHELLQPATGNRYGRAMEQWAEDYLRSLETPDGFVLKSRSPSCGFKDVKVYDSPIPESGSKPGTGMFGGAVLRLFPDTPVEDEGRLKNFVIREHFLGAVWTLARFRAARREGGMNALVDFHARHKYFLLLHNQKELRLLGSIVANHDQRPLSEVYLVYEQGLRRALARPPRYTSLINVIQHAFGGFSDSLSKDERALFSNLLEQYRDERIPASVLLQLVKSWAVRFGESYLLRQVLFEPYPLSLVEITDSGKGRSN
ncbi:MAG: DUF523 and DUF1722 domain-containing protein [Rectinema sp.]|nr:DUF523 and DUF1722 domain-containing protein [Rectinema sp.]